MKLVAMDGGAIGLLVELSGGPHVIDLANRQVSHRFEAGVGCETLAFFEV